MRNTISLLSILLFAVSSAAAQATPQSKAEKPAATAPKGRVAASWQQIKAPPLPDFKPQMPVRFELPNGMVVMLQEDHELPLIEGVARIRGGARELPADKAGMMGIYGQVWRTGGTATKTGDELDDFLEQRAAKVETSGTTDSTTIALSSLKEDFDEVFPIFLELLRKPAFREDKLSLAKQQAKTAISRRNEEMSDIAGREVARLAYGKDSPYARVPEYWTVDSITRDDLLSWHQKYVHPNNIILGLVGDFDAQEMEAKIRKAFEQWPKGPQAQKVETDFKDPKPGVYFIAKGDVTQSSVDLVALGTTRRNPDYYAIVVMNELFGGSSASRLFSNIRSTKGLAYAVGGGIGTNFDYPGIFRIHLGTSSGTTAKAIDALYQEVKDLIARPASTSEVQKAKDNILNSFIFRFDSKEKVLREQMALEFYGYPKDYLLRFRQGIEQVTPADVARVVNKYVDPDKFALLVVGRSEDFDRPLTAFGEVQTIDVTIPTEPPAASGAKTEAAPATGNPEGSRLLEKVAAGLGGKEKVSAVQALSQDTNVTITTPQGKVPVQTSALIVYPDKLKMVTQTPGGQITRVVGPQTAYVEMPGRGTNPMPANMKEDMLRDVKRDPIYVLQHAGESNYTFRAAGTEKIGDVEAQVLDVNADGITVRWYVDPQTGRIIQSRYRTTGMQGPVNRQVTFSDFRDVSGVSLPFKRVVVDDGAEAAVIEVKDLKINPEIPPATFAAPAKDEAAKPASQ